MRRSGTLVLLLYLFVACSQAQTGADYANMLFVRHLYGNELWDESVYLLDSLLAKPPKPEIIRDSMLFYRAIAQYRLSNFEEAEQDFHAISLPRLKAQSRLLGA